MNVYATLTDLPSKHREAEDAEDLIERASNLVTQAIRHAVFTTDESGMPTSPEVLAAAKEATVRQVSTWLSTGVSPLTGFAGKARTVTSKGSNGTTVAYAQDVAQDAWLNLLARGTELTPDARLPLDEAGLTGVAIVSSGPVRPRMYNPVGGTA